MTEVIENIPTGIRWDSGLMDEDIEGGNNSAKLFERSRIKALAGMCKIVVVSFSNSTCSKQTHIMI